MLLADFFQNVYRPLRLRGRSPNTVRLYGFVLARFDEHLGRPATVADLTDLTIAAYLEGRADKHRSPYTIEKERSQLVALGRLAFDRRLLDVKPDVPASVLPQKTPTAWSVDELKRLMAAAASTPGYVGRVPAGIWWSALIHVAFETGERIGALMAATRDAFRPPHLVVPAAARKGRASDKVFSLSARTASLVAQVLANHDDPAVFPWPHPPTHLYYHLGRITKRAGIPSGRSFRFHGIRRAAASHLAAVAGTDQAQRFLGHASSRTTSLWYLDPRISDTGPRPCDVLPDVG